VNSLVYFIARLSDELLVFQAFLICCLVASYTAFWILKKRKLGATPTYVPSGVFKQYLGELISEAHFLRNQLFGILSEHGIQLPQGTGVTPAAGPALTAPAATASGPEFSDLQNKLNQQLAAFQKLEAEKKAIEAQLKTLSAGGAAAAADPKAAAEAEGLKSKVKDLEGKLAEYSIIEDELAQLKRLQQENEELRKLLGPNAPAPTVVKAAAAATAATAAGTPSPVSEAPAPEAPAPETPGPAAPDVSAAPNFDQLVDQVEQSLQPPEPAPAPVEAAATPAAPAPVPAAPAPAPVETAAAPAAPAPAAAPTSGGGDEDLLSEFEKMLNG
jgi:hypothetical protein